CNRQSSASQRTPLVLFCYIVSTRSPDPVAAHANSICKHACGSSRGGAPGWHRLSVTTGVCADGNEPFLNRHDTAYWIAVTINNLKSDRSSDAAAYMFQWCLFHNYD